MNSIRVWSRPSLHLKECGYPLVLASSKPETACERILEKYGLLSRFDEVVGATLDGVDFYEGTGAERSVSADRK